MVDIVTWWCSLNRTEKNSRDLIDKLVLESENIITQELLMWSGSTNFKHEKEDNSGKDDTGKNTKKDNVDDIDIK